MKRKFALLLALMISFFGFSQNEYLDYKYSFSANVLFKQHYNMKYTPQPRQPLSGLTASFFMMDGKRNQHEFSLEKLNFATNSLFRGAGLSYLSKTTDISLGYKYHFNFVKNKNSRWIPSVGLGAHLSYYGTNNRSNNSDYHSTKSSYVGLEYYVQPALTFHASKRIYLNLSLPINLISTGVEFWEMSGTTTEPAYKGASSLRLGSGLNQFQAKFGVGIKF